MGNRWGKYNEGGNYMDTFQNLNQKLLKFLYIFILLVLVSFLNISGCGNGITTIGPEGGTVTTSDGRFTLEIPPGALEEELEIKLDLIASDQNSKTNLQEEGEEDDSGSFLIYEAQPDGLEFLIPAIFSGDVTDISNNDGNNINVMLGFNVTDETTEELGEQTYNVDTSNGNATYTAEVTHFSSLLLLNGTIKIEHSTVPSMKPANSILVDFNVKVTELPNGFSEILSVVYSDFSSPMVLYNGKQTPFNLSETIDGTGHETTQPYDCGNPGSGIFSIDLVLTGSQDAYPIEVFLLLPAPAAVDFTIRVPFIQNVECVGGDDDVMPPPGADDDDDTPPPPPPADVSISANTSKINIVHTIGSSPCPQFGAQIKITVTGAQGEVRIVVKESLSFLNVTPGNILTSMGMAVLTPSFPCSGFQEGMNNGTITVEAQDPDTGEVLDSITIDVMVTVN